MLLDKFLGVVSSSPANPKSSAEQVVLAWFFGCLGSPIEVEKPWFRGPFQLRGRKGWVLHLTEGCIASRA